MTSVNLLPQLTLSFKLINRQSLMNCLPVVGLMTIRCYSVLFLKVTSSMCLYWVSLEVNQYKPTLNMHFARCVTGLCAHIRSRNITQMMTRTILLSPTEFSTPAQKSRPSFPRPSLHRPSLPTPFFLYTSELSLNKIYNVLVCELFSQHMLSAMVSIIFGFSLNCQVSDIQDMSLGDLVHCLAM